MPPRTLGMKDVGEGNETFFKKNVENLLNNRVLKTLRGNISLTIAF